jgi:hypothetical protein
MKARYSTARGSGRPGPDIDRDRNAEQEADQRLIAVLVPPVVRDERQDGDRQQKTRERSDGPGRQVEVGARGEPS